MKQLKISILALFTFFLFGGYGCAQNSTYYLTQGEVFHTSYHIKYAHTQDLGKEIKARLNTFDVSLNPFNAQSIISKVNRNEKVVVDTFFTRVFNKSKDVSIQSEGAFDITCAPLVNLWGFGFQKMNTVTPTMIDSLKKIVGYNKVWIKKGRVVKKDPRITLNCSAIAKGYSCDVVADLLDSYGINDYMVEIGGEIRAKGKNPHGVCWKIEISKPIDDNTSTINERQEVVDLCNQSMATSGNYRNYYIKDGKKYAHTIDPITGYPAENDMLSASVFAKDCMTADAYATAFMVLGVEKSVQLAERLNASGHENLKYYFIYLDKEGKMQIKRN